MNEKLRQIGVTESGRSNMVLITGLLKYDSGKTSVAESIVTDAITRGIDIGVSKPISAVNGWYQYNCIKRSIEYGKLIGEDVYRLHNAAKSSDPLEIESPAVSLLIPPDPERVGWQSSAYMAFSLLDQIAVVRLTNVNESKHFYLPSNIRRISRILQKEIDKLINDIEPRPVKTEKLFVNELLFRSYEIADNCVEYIANRHDFLIVESYNNAASPTRKSLNAMAVVVATPSKVAIYDGDSYRKAMLATSEILEPWRTTTEEILPLIKPTKTVELNPGRRTEGLIDIILKLMVN